MIKNEQVAAARAGVVKAVPEISGIEVWVRGGGTAPSSPLRGDATRYDRLAANFSLLRLHRRDRQHRLYIWTPATACRNDLSKLPLKKTCKYLDQFLIREWLLQHGPVAVSVTHVETAVTGREDERHAMRDERVGHGMAFVAVQIHIQHGGIEDLRINQGEGLIDGGGSGHGLASEVGQHVFDDHKNHHFILDNEDVTAGKQFIHHEHRAVQEC